MVESLKQVQESVPAVLALALASSEETRSLDQLFADAVKYVLQQPTPPLDTMFVSPAQYRRLQGHAEKRSKELELKGIKQPNRAARRRADRRKRC